MDTQDHAPPQLKPEITEDAWIELMHELDSLSVHNSVVERRRHPRSRYTQTIFAACAVEHDDNRWVRSVVRTRDLSASGLSFFHGQYLAAGLNCRVTLQTPDQALHQIAATVRRCSPADETTYVVGIEFNELIEPERFTGSVAPVFAGI